MKNESPFLYVVSEVLNLDHPGSFAAFLNRDSEHASEVYRHLEECGYHVQPEGQGDRELQ